MGSDEGLAGDIGSHLAITQEQLGKHGKDGAASGALHTPEGETAEANTSIMGVASQSTAAVTARFRVELKAQREDEGQDELDERLAIMKQLCGCGFIVEIDGEGSVFAFRFGGLGHVSSPSG
jgi:hypothetical protein